MSIRGNCAQPPTKLDLAVLENTPGAAGLLPMQDRQCLIMSNEDLFHSLSPRVWYDNLYLRAVYYNAPTPERWQQVIVLASVPDLPWPLHGLGARYFTRVTFQGDGTGPAIAAWPSENTYIENCTFADLGGDGRVCDDCTSAFNAKNTSVTLLNSTFFSPAPFPKSTFVRAWEGARFLISGCQFSPLTAPQPTLFVGRDNATLYSDDASIRVMTDAGTFTGATPEAAVPALTPDKEFLTRSDPWFVALREALNVTLPPQPAYAPPATPVPRLPRVINNTAPENPDLITGTEEDSASIAPVSRDSSDPTVAFLVAALVVLSLLLACMCVIAIRERRLRLRPWRQQSEATWMKAGPEAVGAAADGSSAKAQTWSPQAVCHTDVYGERKLKGPFSEGALGRRAWGKGSQPGTEADLAIGDGSLPEAVATRFPSYPTSFSGASHGAALCYAVGSGGSAAVSIAAPPGSEAVAGCCAEWLQAQLDMISGSAIVLNRFQLLGRSERVQGGQSVVAFASCMYDRSEYAIKFFQRRAGFAAERALRSSATLHAILPRAPVVHDPEDDPAGESDRGRSVRVPCIVMPRGESLEEWSRRARPDVFQAAAVLSQLADQLRALHAAGYVHCAVKPAHILQLHRENRWTLVDFSGAGAAGNVVAVRLLGAYTPPEVTAAAEAAASASGSAGSVALVASPSMDAWGLGVVAYELLTGEHLLQPRQDGSNKVAPQLRGAPPWPWEAGALPPDTLRKLGIFRKPVLGMLHREPAQRATMASFCDACYGIVSSHTTTA